jgi:hypothetical protein
MGFRNDALRAEHSREEERHAGSEKGLATVTVSGTSRVRLLLRQDAGKRYVPVSSRRNRSPLRGGHELVYPVCLHQEQLVEQVESAPTDFWISRLAVGAK